MGLYTAAVASKHTNQFSTGAGHRIDVEDRLAGRNLQLRVQVVLDAVGLLFHWVVDGEAELTDSMKTMMGRDATSRGQSDDGARTGIRSESTRPDVPDVDHQISADKTPIQLYGVPSGR